MVSRVSTGTWPVADCRPILCTAGQVGAMAIERAAWQSPSNGESVPIPIWASSQMWRQRAHNSRERLFPPEPRSSPPFFGVDRRERSCG